MTTDTITRLRNAADREFERQWAREQQRLAERAAIRRARDDAWKRDRAEQEARRPVPKKDQPRCGAKTRAGGTCIMRVVPGKKRCRLHGGLSTGPKTPEGIERIRQAQARRWRLEAKPSCTVEEMVDG